MFNIFHKSDSEYSKADVEYSELINSVDALDYSTIKEAEKAIRKHERGIRHTVTTLDSKDLTNMERDLRVNCMHKGNFETVTGRKVMVPVDGTTSSDRAFQLAMSLLHNAPGSTDHLFIVVVYDKYAWWDDYEDYDIKYHNETVVLKHNLWEAACTIAKKYENEVLEKAPHLDYTTIVIGASDPRAMVSVLAKKYKMDLIVVGQHANDEKKENDYWGSFHSYIEKYTDIPVRVAKKGMMAFSNEGSLPDTFPPANKEESLI